MGRKIDSSTHVLRVQRLTSTQEQKHELATSAPDCFYLTFT